MSKNKPILQNAAARLALLLEQQTVLKTCMVCRPGTTCKNGHAGLLSEGMHVCLVAKCVYVYMKQSHKAVCIQVRHDVIEANALQATAQCYKASELKVGKVGVRFIV